MQDLDGLILDIQDLARGGAGVARDDQGRVIFVPYTSPGDRVRVRIVTAEKNYAQADLIEVLAPSPQRVQPSCPVFGRCGGCQWQHLPYEVQWRTKVQGVLHALKRVQVIPACPLEEIPATRIWEYRNRVQLRGFKEELGFFASGTQNLVPVDRCAIARPEINVAWEETKAQGFERDRPYKVEVEVLEDGSIRRTWNSSHAAAGFRQVHDEQNERLKDWVRQSLATQSSGSGVLLDLYGGSGNLSRLLEPHYSEIYRVDAYTRGISAQKIHFERQAVAPWLVKKSAMGLLANSAILDPPREGLAGDFAKISTALAKMGVKELVAVGCDPDSWARDVGRFVKNGWRLEKAAALDLFPQTIHVESLAYLRRVSHALN